MKRFRKAFVTLVCLMCAVFLSGCGTMLFTHKTDKVDSQVGGREFSYFVSLDFEGKNSDGDVLIYPETTLAHLQNRAVVVAEVTDRSIIPPKRENITLDTDDFILTAIAHIDDNADGVYDITTEINNIQSTLWDGGWSTYDVYFTFTLTTTDAWGVFANISQPFSQQYSISDYPTISNLTFEVKDDVYDSTPVNTSKSHDFLNKIDITGDTDVVIMPELCEVTSINESAPSGDKPFSIGSNDVVITYKNGNVSSDPTPVTAKAAKVTSITAKVNEELAYLSGDTWYRNADAFASANENYTLGYDESKGDASKTITLKETDSDDNNYVYMYDRDYVAFLSGSRTWLERELIEVTLHDEAGNDIIVSGNYTDERGNSVEVVFGDNNVSVKYLDNLEASFDLKYSDDTSNSGVFAEFEQSGSEYSHVFYSYQTASEALLDNGEPIQGIKVYLVAVNGRRNVTNNSANYQFIGDLSLDLGTTPDASGKYAKAVTIALASNANISSKFNVEVTYASITGAEFSGEVPVGQLANRQLNPSRGQNGEIIDGAISFKWQYAEGKTSVDRYYLEQGTEKNAWVDCGNIEYKVYYFTTPYNSAAAPTVGWESGSDSEIDEAHTTPNSDSTHQPRDAMSKSVTWVRIVYRIKENASLGQSEVLGYSDFRVTPNLTSQAYASLASIGLDSVNWDCLEENGSDKVYGADKSVTTGGFASFASYLKQSDDENVTSNSITPTFWWTAVGTWSAVRLESDDEVNYKYDGKLVLTVSGQSFRFYQAGKYKIVLALLDGEDNDYMWPESLTGSSAQFEERPDNKGIGGSVYFEFTVNPMQGVAGFELISDKDGKLATTDSFTYQVQNVGTDPTKDILGSYWFYLPNGDNTYYDLGIYTSAKLSAANETKYIGAGATKYGDAVTTGFTATVYYYGKSYSTGADKFDYTEGNAVTTAPTLPGEYYAYVEFADFGNYKGAKSKPFKFNITRQQISVSWQGADGYNYETSDSDKIGLTYREVSGSAVQYAPVSFIKLVDEMSGSGMVYGTDWKLEYVENYAAASPAESGDNFGASETFSNAAKYHFILRLSDEFASKYTVAPADTTASGAGIVQRVDTSVTGSTDTIYRGDILDIEFVIKQYNKDTSGNAQTLSVSIANNSWQYHSYSSTVNAITVTNDTYNLSALYRKNLYLAVIKGTADKTIPDDLSATVQSGLATADGSVLAHISYADYIAGTNAQKTQFIADLNNLDAVSGTDTYRLVAYITSAYDYDATNGIIPATGEGTDFTNYAYVQSTVDFTVTKLMIARPTSPSGGNIIYLDGNYTKTSDGTYFAAGDKYAEVTFGSFNFKADGGVESGAVVITAKTTNVKTAYVLTADSAATGYIAVKDAAVYVFEASLSDTAAYKWATSTTGADSTAADDFNDKFEITFVVLRKGVDRPANGSDRTYEKDTKHYARAVDIDATTVGAVWNSADNYYPEYGISNPTVGGKTLTKDGTGFYAKDAGEYHLTFTLTGNYYWTGGTGDNDFASGGTASMQYPTTTQTTLDWSFTVKPREIVLSTAYTKGGDGNYTLASNSEIYKGTDQTIVLDFAYTYDSKTVDLNSVFETLNADYMAGKTPDGANAYTWGSAVFGGSAGTNNYTVTVRYAGTYTVTLEIKDPNYCWDASNTDTTSRTVTFVIGQKEIAVDWASFGGVQGSGDNLYFVFEKDKGRTLIPVIDGTTGTDDAPVYVDGVQFTTEVWNSDNTSKLGDGAHSAKGDYYTRITGIKTAAAAEGIDGATLTLAFNYVFAMVESVDPAVIDPAKYHKAFKIISQDVALPTLNGSQTGVTGKTVTVEYSGSGYRFSTYVSALGTVEFDDWWSLLGVSVDGTSATEKEVNSDTVTTNATGEALLKAVKWSDGKVVAYTVVIGLADSANYSWEEAADGTKYESTDTFTFTFLITPIVVDYVDTADNNATKPYEVNYDGSEHEFFAAGNTAFGSVLTDYTDYFDNGVLTATGNKHTNVKRNGSKAVDNYQVTLAISDDNYVWTYNSTDGTVDKAAKNYFMRVNPVDIGVVWDEGETNPLERTYSADSDGTNATAWTPTAKIAALGEHDDSAGVELKIGLAANTSAAGYDSEHWIVATTDGKVSVTNAGYYIASATLEYEEGEDGDTAYNLSNNYLLAVANYDDYKVEKENTATADFTVFKKAIARPSTTAGDVKEYTYNRKAQSATVGNFNGDLIEFDSENSTAYSFLQTEAEQGTDSYSHAIDKATAEYKDGVLTVSATDAGMYGFAFSLKYGYNYCWAPETVGATADAAKGESNAPDGSVVAYEAGTFLTINQKTITAPVITRGVERSGDNSAVYPSFTNAEGTLVSTDTMFANSALELTAAITSVNLKLTAADGDGNDWIVPVGVSYTDGTNGYKADSEIGLVLTFSGSDSYNYKFAASGSATEEAEKSQLGIEAQDIIVPQISDGELSVTLYFMVTRTTFKLELGIRRGTSTDDVTSWTYGEGLDAKFYVKTGAGLELLPDDYLGTITVEYRARTGNDVSDTVITDLVTIGAGVPSIDVTATENRSEFVPGKLPYKAGEYAARITYTAIDNQKDTYQTQTYTVPFTIEKKAIAINPWADTFTYDGQSHMTAPTLASGILVESVSDVTTGDNLVLSTGYYKDGAIQSAPVNASATAYPVIVYGFADDSEGEENYTIYASDNAAEGAYVTVGGKNILSGLTGTLTINRRAVTVTAADDNMTFGNAEGKIINGGALSIADPYTVGATIVEGDNVSKAKLESDFADFFDGKYEVRAIVKDNYSSYVQRDSHVSDTTHEYSTAIYTGTASSLLHTYNGFTNYDIKLVDGTFTITPATVTIVWADDDFTYNGKVQYTPDKASYTADDTRIAYYEDIDGNEIRLDVIDITKSGAAADFKYVGEYTFTITATGDDNYTLPTDATELSAVYHVAKRVVTIVAEDITTTYGTEATAEQKKWKYGESSAMFVNDSGDDISENATVYDGVTPHTFNVLTAATRTTKPNDLKAKVYITLDSANTDLTGTYNGFDNYTVKVEAGEHTVNKYVLVTADLEQETTAYTYNGSDQTATACTNSVYFTDKADDTTKHYLQVVAVSNNTSTSAIAFVNAGPYTFYVSALATDDADCYEFGDSSVLDRYYAVTMNKRAVTIKIDDAGYTHIYGETIDQSNLTWSYDGTSAGDTDAAKLLQFVDVQNANGIYTVDPTNTGKSFTVKIVGKSVTLGNTTGVGAYDLGVEYGDTDSACSNYIITVTNADSDCGTLTVDPRPVKVTVGAIGHEYGETIVAFADPTHYVVSAHGDLTEAIVNNDRGTDSATKDNTHTTVANGVFELKVSFGSDSSVIPAAGDYAITLTLKNNNYKVYVGETEISVDKDATSVDTGCKYTVSPSTKLSTIATDIANTYTYDGGVHALDGAAPNKPLTVDYYSTNGTQSTSTVTTSALGNTVEAGNNLTWYFYYGSTAPAAPTSVDDLTANGWTTSLPWSGRTDNAFTYAGTYTVYYAVVADNHVPALANDGAPYSFTVNIDKAEVQVALTLSVYYGETEPLGKHFAAHFAGLENGESITYTGSDSALSGTVTGVAGLENTAITFTSAYVQGNSVGKYNVTIDLTALNAAATNYTFSAMTAGNEITVNDKTYYANQVVVNKLPIAVSVASDLEATYWDDATTLEAQLAAALDYTVSAKDKDGADITELYTGDVITLTSAAISGSKTNVVGSYDITIKSIARGLTIDVKGNYDITESFAKFIINPADLQGNKPTGYGSDTTKYDEKEHNAIVEDLGTVLATRDNAARKWSYKVLGSDPGAQAAVTADTFAGIADEVTMPKFIDADTYWVAYRVQADNHNTAYGYVTVKIGKATNEWKTAYAMSGATDKEISAKYGEWNVVSGETLPVAKFNKKPGADATGDGREKPVVTIEKDGDSSFTTVTLDSVYDSANNRWNLKPWFSAKSSEYSEYTNSQLLDVGTYRVKVSMAGNDNFEAIGEATVLTVIITKAELTFKGTTNNSFVYGTDYEEMKASLNGDTSYAYTIDGFKPWHVATAGGDRKSLELATGITAKPQLTVTKSENEYAAGYDNGSVDTYSLDIGLSGFTATNYTFVAQSGSVKITKKAITFTIKDDEAFYDLNRSITSAWDNVVFDFDMKPAAVNSTDLEKLRRLLNSAGVTEWNEDASNHRVWRTNNVGKYDIYLDSLASADNDYHKNYSWTASIKGTFTVKQAILDIDVKVYESEIASGKDYTLANATFTYDGSAKKLGAINKAQGDGSASSIQFTTKYFLSSQSFESATEEAPQNAGTYVARFVLNGEGSDNYYYNDSVSYYLIINKREVEATYTLTHTKKYGDSYYSGNTYDGNEYYYDYAFTSWDGMSANGGVITDDLTAMNGSVILRYTSGGNTTTARPRFAGTYNVSAELNSENSVTANYTLANTTPDTIVISRKQISAVTMQDGVGGSKTLAYVGDWQDVLFGGFYNGTDNVAPYPYDGTTPIMTASAYCGDNVLSFVSFAGQNGYNNKLSVYDAGTYTVVIKLNDVANYTWSGTTGLTVDMTAGTITYTITVNKATLYVTTTDYGVQYGEAIDETKIADITSKLTFTGLVGEDAGKNAITVGIVTVTEDSDTYTFSRQDGSVYTTYSDVTATNTFNIRANIEEKFESANYSLVITKNAQNAEVYGQLTVSPRKLTVRVEDVTVDYKDNVHTNILAGYPIAGTAYESDTYLSIVNDGGLAARANTDGWDALGISFKTDGANVGAWELVPTSGNTNYDVKFVGDSTEAPQIVVNSRELTVIITNGEVGTVVYGNTPVYKVTFSGFVAGAEDFYIGGMNGTALTLTNGATDVEAIQTIVGTSKTSGTGPDKYTLWESFATAVYNLSLDASGYLADGTTSGNGFRNYTVKACESTLTVSRRIISAQITNAEDTFDYGGFVAAGRNYNAFSQPADIVYNYGEGVTVPSGYEANPTVTYTGTRADGAEWQEGTTGLPNHAGSYTVDIRFASSDNYRFVNNALAATPTYTINRAQIEVSTDNMYETGAYTTVQNYDHDVMNFTGFTYNGVNLEGSSVSGFGNGSGISLEYTAGKLQATSDSIGNFSITVVIRGGDYQNDFRFASSVAANGVTSITLSYQVVTNAESLGFTVSVTVDDMATSRFGYSTQYGVSSSANGVDLDEIREKVSYTYVALGSGYETLNAGDNLSTAQIEALSGRFTSDKPVNAGKYAVRAILPAGEGYPTARATLVFVIDKLSIDAPTLAAGNITYNGSWQDKTLNGYNDNTMIISVVSGVAKLNSSDMTGKSVNAIVDTANAHNATAPYANISVLNAGEYTFTVRLRDAVNYEWKAGSVGVTDGVYNGKFTVAKANNGLANTLTAKTVEYGENYDVFDLTTISGDNATIKYRLSSGGEYFEASALRHAGRYRVQVSAAESYDYNSFTLTPESYRLTITPATLTVTLKTATIYYGQEISVLDGHNEYYDITGFKYNDATVSGIISGTVNYNSDDTYSAGSAITDATHTYNLRLESDCLIIADEYEDDYVIDYDNAVLTGGLTVAPRPVVVAINGQSAVYSGNKPNVASAEDTDWNVASVDNTANYGVYGTDDLAVTLAIVAKADGMWTVRKYDITGVSDNANYDVTFSGGKDKFDITRLQITLSDIKVSGGYTYDPVSGASVPTNNNFALTYTVTVNGNTETCTWGVNDSANIAKPYLSLEFYKDHENDLGNIIVPRNAAGGYYAHIYSADTVNVNVTTSSDNPAVTVAKFVLSTATIRTQLGSALEFEYNGSVLPAGDTTALIATIEGASATLYNASLYTVNTIRGDCVNVGTYNNGITLTLTDSDNCAWANGNANLAFAITKAKLTVNSTASGSASWKYDGTVRSTYTMTVVNENGDNMSASLFTATYSVRVSTDNGSTWSAWTAANNLGSYASVGKYEYKIVIAGNANYNDAESVSAIAYTVEKRAITSVTVSADTKLTDGKFIAGAYGATLANVAYTVTLERATGDDEDIIAALESKISLGRSYTGTANDGSACVSGSLPAAENGFYKAGTYSVSPVFDQAANPNYTCSATMPTTDYVVQRNAVAGTAINVKTATYNNVPQSVLAFVNHNTRYGTAYVLEDETATYTNAGTYDFNVVLVDVYNYYWSSNSADIYAETLPDGHNVQTLKFTINQAVLGSATLTQFTFADDGVQQNVDIASGAAATWEFGSEITAVGGNVTLRYTNGTMTYNRSITSGFTFSYYKAVGNETDGYTVGDKLAGVPSDAGKYFVQAQLIKSTNPNFSNIDAINDGMAKILVIEITPITNHVAIAGRDSFEYGVEVGFDITLTFDDGVVTLVYYKGSVSEDNKLDAAPRDVGSYVVKATVADTTNYTGDSSTKDFAITKATLRVSAVSGSVDYGSTFAGSSGTYVLSGFKYDDAEKQASIIIGAPTYKLVSGIALGGVATHAGAVEIDTVGTLDTTSGNYDFVIDNTVKGTLSVTPKAITVTLANQSAQYTGSAITPVQTNSDERTVWTVETDGLVPDDSESDLGVVVSTLTDAVNAGSYVLVGSISNPNYTATFERATFTVRKREIDGSAVSRALGQDYTRLTYNGTEQRITDGGALEELVKAHITGRFVDIYDYFANDDYSAYKNASTYDELFFILSSDVGFRTGTYYAYVTLKDDVYSNFKWKDGEATYTFTFTISASENSVTLSIVFGDEIIWEYDGKSLISREHGNSVATDGAFGLGTITYEYARKSDTVTEGDWSSVAPTDAGEYLVRAVIPGTDDYAEAKSEPVEFTISPRRLSAEISAKDGTVNLSSIEHIEDPSILRLIDYDITYYGESNDGSWAHTAEEGFTEAPTKPGKYTMSVNLKADGINDVNYVLDVSGETKPFVTSVLDIAKLILSIRDVITTKLQYNGAQQSAADSLKDDANYGVLYRLSENVFATNAGSDYSAHLVLLDNHNYEWAESESASVEYKWSIEKCKLARPISDNCKVNGKDDSFVYFVNLGFDSSLVSVSGDTASGEGDYTATVSIIDKDNYEWEDGTTDDILLDWHVSVPVPAGFIIGTILLSLLLVGSGWLCVFIAEKFRMLKKKGVRR